MENEHKKESEYGKKNEHKEEMKNPMRKAGSQGQRRVRGSRRKLKLRHT